MPEPPLEVKHHPASVNQLLLKHIVRGSKQTKLAAFLEKEFACISRAHAAQLVGTCATVCLEIFTGSGELHGLEADTPIKALTDKDVSRLTQLFKEVKFEQPDGLVCNNVGCGVRALTSLARCSV